MSLQMSLWSLQYMKNVKLFFFSFCTPELLPLSYRKKRTAIKQNQKSGKLSL